MQNRDGLFPLGSAALTGSLDVVRALVDHRASLAQANARGDSALQLAHASGKSECVELLTELNSPYGWRPFFRTLWHNPLKTLPSQLDIDEAMLADDLVEVREFVVPDGCTAADCGRLGEKDGASLLASFPCDGGQWCRVAFRQTTEMMASSGFTQHAKFSVESPDAQLLYVWPPGLLAGEPLAVPYRVWKQVYSVKLET